MGKLARRVDAYVGERIRERRTAMGLTQDHLAGALEISYQQVQKYETGANRVSAGRLYEVAKKLDVDVSYFFEGLDEQAEVQPLEHGGKNRSTIELVRNFSHIGDPQIRSALSGLVKSLVPENRRQEFELDDEGAEAPAQRMSGHAAPADQGDD
jgi:transcriptional regulator with XRE-family HTH domain